MTPQIWNGHQGNLCYQDNILIFGKDSGAVANSADPDQTAPFKEQSDLDLHCLYKYTSSDMAGLLWHNISFDFM